MSFDTTVVILAKLWSDTRQILYVSGNFGWVRALKLTIKQSISGISAAFEPGWSSHEKSAWIQHLTIDNKNNYLIGSSGTEVMVFNLDDGSIAFRFQTQHTMELSAVQFSDERLMLYTGAPDGLIKGWRLFDKKPQCVMTIKQAQLGPILIELDKTSFFTISHERVLRRYNKMSTSPIAEYNLDIAKTKEEKDVESPIFLQVVSYKKKNWVFFSEGLKVSLFEALWAPSELAICCDCVSEIVIDSESRVFALCRNNVLHELYCDGTDGGTFDLDNMEVLNIGKSHTVSQPETTIMMQNDVIFIGYEGGQIKVFDLKKHELYEMVETNKETPIQFLAAVGEIFPDRHVYCKGINSSNDFKLLTNSYPGSFTLHCAKCYNFIGSWTVTDMNILKMEQVPQTSLIISLERTRLTLWDFSKGLGSLFTFPFDEYDIGFTFDFATEDIVFVAMTNGKACCYQIVNGAKPTIIHTTSMRLFNTGFRQICSCRVLKHQKDGLKIIEEENLDGIVCATSLDDKFCVADALTGLIQYTLDLPKHKENSRFSIVAYRRAMIVLSVDQNVRLLVYPNYRRIVPVTYEDEKKQPQQQQQPQDDQQKSLRPFDDSDDTDLENAEIKSSTSHDKIIHSTASLERLSRSTASLSRVSTKDLTSIKPKREYTEEIIQQTQTTKLVIPDSEKKKTMFLEYENGWPRIVVKDLSGDEDDKSTKSDKKDEQSKPENAEEEDNDYNDEDTESEANRSFEFTQRQEVFVDDIIKMNMLKTTDEVARRNQEIYERIMAENPVAKEKFQTKALKRISTVQYYSDEEDNDEDFYDTFLTLHVKTLVPKQSRPNTSRESPQTPPKPKFDLLNHPRPEGIKPIKRHKPRRKKAKKYLVLEFKDGTKIRTDERTAALLRALTENARQEEQEEQADYNTPGLIFHEALAELNKNRQVKNKNILIQEQQLLALPIQTLTSGGLTFGAMNKRYFKKQPYMRFVVNQIGGSSVINVNNGNYIQAPFFHWEGVTFDDEKPRRKKEKIKNFASFDVLEEEEEYEEESYEEDGEGTNKRKTLSRENTQALSSADSVAILPSGALFDKSNPMAAKILNASPQIQAIDKMFGNSDNPLLDFLNQMPNISTDDIIKELNSGRPQPVSWHPLQLGDYKGTQNVFQVGGLQNLPSFNETDRVPSPRIVDPWRMVQNSSYNPDAMGLGTISEVSDDNSSASDFDLSTDDDFQEDSKKEKPLTQAQSFLQMHLRRNDFQALRNILDEDGLLDNNDVFVNVPKWQPTVQFVPKHIRIPGPFDPDLPKSKAADMKKPFKNGTSSEINILHESSHEGKDKLVKSVSGEIRPMEPVLSDAESLSSRSQSARSGSRPKSQQNSRGSKRGLSSDITEERIEDISELDETSEEVGDHKSLRSKSSDLFSSSAGKSSEQINAVSSSEQLEKGTEEEHKAEKAAEEEEIDQEGQISDSFSSLDDDVGPRSNDVDDDSYYVEEEEIIEEEEIGDDGKPHFKISKGITRVFKHSKIGDAKTRKVTDYSHIKYQHDGPRELYKETDQNRRKPPENVTQERQRRGDLKISEGLQLKRGQAKKIKVIVSKDGTVKRIPISEGLKLQPKEEEKPKPVRIKKKKKVVKEEQSKAKRKKKVVKEDGEKQQKRRHRHRRRKKTSNLDKDNTIPLLGDDVKLARSKSIDEFGKHPVQIEDFETKQFRKHLEDGRAKSANHSSESYEYDDFSDVVFHEEEEEEESEHKEEEQKSDEEGYVYVYEEEEKKEEEPKEKEKPKPPTDLATILAQVKLNKPEEKSQKEKKNDSKNDAKGSDKSAKGTAKNTSREDEEPSKKNYYIPPRNVKITKGPVRRRNLKRKEKSKEKLENPLDDTKPDSHEAVEESHEEEKGEPHEYEEEEIYEEEIHEYEEDGQVLKKVVTKSKIVDNEERLAAARAEAEREEEERLRQQLMANTVEAGGVMSEEDLLKYDVAEKKPLIVVEEPKIEKRPTHLGEEIELHEFGSENNEFESKYRLRKSKLLRSVSHDFLIKENFKKKPVIRMFDNTDLSYASTIFLGHYAPTLFQKRTGKLRRNSLNLMEKIPNPLLDE